MDSVCLTCFPVSVWLFDMIVSAVQSDYDMVDYLNELREGCLEAYTGIVQGLKGDNNETVNR